MELDGSSPQKLATLHLSGPNVVTEYVSNVGQDRFTFDDFGTSLYNTGDIVYLDEDTQELYFAGRADNQIKRNGFRIELEEIESVIEEISGVSGCIAVFDPSKQYDLVAHIESTMEIEYLTQAIKQNLPIYMHPKKIHLVEKLPRNQNGKKDRSMARNIEMS